MTVFEIIYNNKVAFFNGLLVTLQLSLWIWILGLIFGMLFGILAHKIRVINIVNRFLAFLLSGIPVLVFLFWAHYPLQSILDIVIDPFVTSVVVLSIVNIFSVSSIILHSLNNFPQQYITAAIVCGLSSKQIFYKIKFPLILREVLPPILMTQVNMLQMTLFASLISVEEIFRVAQRINAIEYKPVEIYTALAIFFLIICLPLNGLALWLKKKFTRNISEMA